MEDIPCIFCGKLIDNIAISENGYKGRKCEDCNLIFISPRPTSDEITNLYVDEHAISYANAQFPIEKIKIIEAKATLKKIIKFKKGGSLLELGCGGGAFLAEARNFGFEPYGIELNPIECKWITSRLRIPCETKSLNNGSFGGKMFNIIYHRDVLSHLYDPIKSFHDMNNALQPNGLLVFETGNIADIDKNYYKLFTNFAYPDHLFFYGERSLKMLLKKTGYTIIYIYRENLILHLILQKALWFCRNAFSNKDSSNITKHQDKIYENGSTPIKTKLKLLYHYINYFLIKISGVLPQKGRPLKLLIIAAKKA